MSETVESVLVRDGRLLTKAKQKISEGANEVHYRFLDNYGFIPAVHYLETLETAELESISGFKVFKSRKLEGDFEIDCDDLIQIPGYNSSPQTYNVILLNSWHSHPMTVVLEEFRDFLIEKRRLGKDESYEHGGSDPLRLLIKDMPPDDFPSLQEMLNINSGSSKHSVCMYSERVDGRSSVPLAVYFHLYENSKGLRKKIGQQGAYYHSDLEKRLELK